jgi:hypothetical protein
VVAQKFAEKVHTMAAAEVNSNPPLSPIRTPLFQIFSKGEFLPGVLTPLWKILEKRVKGDFLTE